MSTQIIACAKETKSKKLLFQELPYHGVNIIFYDHGQVLKSLGSLYMYMRVFTVFEQFLCLLTWDFKCHTVPSAPLSFQTLIPAYRIYSINRPGRLLNFWTLRVGAYSRWALIRGWALIKFSPFSASEVCLFCNKTINANNKTRRSNKARFL